MDMEEVSLVQGGDGKNSSKLHIQLKDTPEMEGGRASAAELAKGGAQAPKASWWGCQFNMTNAAIGAGMVCLPNTFKDNGWLVAGLLLVFVGLLSAYSHRFLAISGAWSGRKSMRGLIKEVFGSKGEVTFVVLVLLLLLGPMTAYYNLSAKFISEVIEKIWLDSTERTPEQLATGYTIRDEWYLNKWFVSAMCGVLIKFPLSLIQPLSKLAGVSFVALVIIVYTILLVIVRGSLRLQDIMRLPPALMPKWDAAILTQKILGAAAVCGFSYANHFIYLEVVSEMERPTNKRQSALLWGSNGFITLVYIAVGLLGYLGFSEVRPGGKAADNVLSQMAGADVLVCKILFALMMCLSYPLVLSPARDNILWLLRHFSRRQEDHLVVAVTAPGGRAEVTGFRKFFTGSDRLFLPVTLALLIVTFVLANAFKSVNSVLEVFFSLAGGILVFVIPALCFLLLGERKRLVGETAVNVKRKLSGLQRAILRKAQHQPLPDAEVVGTTAEDFDDFKARQTFEQHRTVTMTVFAVLNILFGIFLTTVGTALSIKNVVNEMKNQ